MKKLSDKTLDRIGSFMIWSGLLYIFLWLVAKTLGWINTPALLLYSPGFVAIYTIGGFLIRIGRRLEKFDFLLKKFDVLDSKIGTVQQEVNIHTKDISFIKTEIKHINKDIAQINAKVF